MQRTTTLDTQSETADSVPARTWYEVEGAGPDRIVAAESGGEAAQMVADHQAEGPVELTWLDAGSMPGNDSRWAWERGDISGRCTVSTVSAEMSAFLTDQDFPIGEILEASEMRAALA